ncbi:MAG: hypothetical protein ACRERC_13170 [Candidatus Binatia bacterium]
MPSVLRRPARTAALLALLAGGCDAALPEPESAPALLYAQRCAGCHRLYAPGLMTGEMWKVTVARMQGELARRGLPPLDAAQQASLLDYLSRHASDRGG